jgi:hypothetical protein
MRDQAAARERRSHSSKALGIAHDLARVADRLQMAGDDFVERRSFRAGDLNDAIVRRRDCGG